MRNEQLLTDAESKRRRAERLRQIAPGITRLPDWKMLLDQADQLDEEALRLEAEAEAQGFLQRGPRARAFEVDRPSPCL